METVFVQMEEDMLAELKRRAESMHLFSSEYCSLIITRYMMEKAEEKELQST